MMDTPRVSPMEIFFSPAANDDLLYLPPHSRQLQYGDSLIVSADQFAEFRCGGQTIHFKDPGVYCIGFDKRTPEEIMLSAMLAEAEENQLLMLNTSVVFCDLRPRLEHTFAPEKDIMLTPAVGMRPRFSCTLRVDPEHVRAAIAWVDKGARLIDQASRAAARHLGKRISAMCSFYEQSTLPDIARELEESQEEMEDVLSAQDAGCVLQRYGIVLEDIRVTDWDLHTGYCSECGERVEDSVYHRVTSCVNHHPQEHCPRCDDLLYGPRMNKRCLLWGHPILFCTACGTYVNAPNGKCSIHG